MNKYELDTKEQQLLNAFEAGCLVTKFPLVTLCRNSISTPRYGNGISRQHSQIGIWEREKPNPELFSKSN